MTIGGTENSGLLVTNGALTFIAMIVGVRTFAVHEHRPIRWTRPLAVATLVAVCALALASISYGLLHPLSSGTAEMWDRPSVTHSLQTYLHNDGRARVELVSVTVPGVALAGSRSDERPIAGAPVIHEDTRLLELDIAQPCRSTVIDRLDVRYRVHGRELSQVVRLREPVTLSCA